MHQTQVAEDKDSLFGHIGERTTKPEPLTTVAAEGIMQDMEETGPGMVKAHPGTVETRLIRQMLY